MGSDYYCFLCSAGFSIPYEVETGEDFDEDEDEASENEHQIDEEDDGSDDDLGGDSRSGEDRDTHPLPDSPGNHTPVTDRQAEQGHPRRMKELFPRETVAPRLQWLTKFRIIGENPDSTGINKCYLSGPATEEDFWQVTIEPGDHPNARGLDAMVDCYQSEDNPAAALPIHDSCLVVLSAVFAQAQDLSTKWTPDMPSTSLPFSLDTMFACLAEKRVLYQFCMELGNDLPVDQYFHIHWDQVFNYFDPAESLQFNISPDAAAEREPTTPGRFTRDHEEPFDLLPDELLLCILKLTNKSDLASLLGASRTVRRICESNAFWDHRLDIDAPWLRIDGASERPRSSDCRRVYRDVMMQTLKPVELAGRGLHVSGLANRERIWKNAKQVQRLYERLSPLDSQIAGKAKSTFETDAICRFFSRVANHKMPKLRPETIFFFLESSDIRLPKRIEFIWSENLLAGITTHVGAHLSTCGASLRANKRVDIVNFEPDDWIDRLVLNIGILGSPASEKKGGKKKSEALAVTGVHIYSLRGNETVLGETDGYKRFLEPHPGHGIVGLRTEYAEDKISRFGIVEHSNGPTKQRMSKDPKYLKHLWTKHPLPPDLCFGEAVTGYWSSDTHLDLLPMELILLGTTEDELSSVVGFGQAIDGRSFAVYRDDGSSNIVGTSDAPFKKFDIDGPDGERVVGYEVTVGPLPVGLRLVTNRGRQAVFGTLRDNGHVRFTSEDGMGLAGLYCCFGYNSRPKALLSILGPVRSPHLNTLSMNQFMPPDDNGIVWEPRPPPTAWHACGPLYGTKHNGEVALTFDFKRPIAKIEGLLPAPEWLEIIGIGGFTITYGGDSSLDSTLDFGWPSRQWPKGPNATAEQLQQIEWLEGISMFASREVAQAAKLQAGTSHVANNEEALAQPSTWSLDPDVEKVIAVTVWAGDFLNGIQFHSDSGKDSPKWGKCGGEPSGVIRVGGSENVVGLKMILGTLRFQYKTKTLFPQAVQALEKKE